MYAHMLVGMVALTGEWWADVREPSKEKVITQVVNMAWNGVSGLEKAPGLVTREQFVSEARTLPRAATCGRRRPRHRGVASASDPDLDLAPLTVLSRVSRLARRLDRAREQAFATHAWPSGSSTCWWRCVAPGRPTG